MLLSVSLANKIIKEVEKLCNEEIIIVDVNGKIIASTELSRIGSFHEGAFLCVQEREKKMITKKDEILLKGVKAGLNLPVFFLNKVIGVIGITGEPHQFLRFGELLRKMTELLIQESYYREQSQWRSRMMETFVYDWLHGKNNAKDLLERAKLMGVDLHIDRQVILVNVDQPQENLFQGLWQLTHIWNDTYEDDILIPWGDGQIMLIHCGHQPNEQELIASKVKQLQTYMSDTWQIPVNIGIGQTVKAIDLQISHKQAEKALRATHGEGTIVFENQMDLDLCLQEISEETRIEYIHRVLSIAEKDQELLETFRVYFQENLSIKATAEALHIHINTLHYRIKKLENLTGLNLKYVKDLVNLYLSIYFLDEHTKNPVVSS
ncbi:CdaR family transcriptional regulator [Bacillus sp. 1P06AnD]|uniref:CdaR family transcriptional regulator n=1 Tax=Bacillus sp. 1P06AnD TaxID=3132208 RepID=UPI0039A2E513